MNYYNEFDPKAAQWLRNLIEAGKVPQGYVDERSITEVDPNELKRYTQCHFFAGIGGWSYALELAGWPADRPVWTGSCPCQPFSSVGKQKGQADERHLWPVWFNLIRSCKPDVVFGEQVASAIGHGWLDGVYDDMEAEDYTIGAAVLPACSVNAPHRRDRLWFVADTEGIYAQGCKERPRQGELGRDCKLDGNVGNANQYGLQQGEQTTTALGQGCAINTTGSNVANTSNTRPQGHGRYEQQHDAQRRQEQNGHNPAFDFWSNTTWIDCPDGKQRRVEPSIRLLADGVSARVVRLRAYGNAIVPQVAAQIIRAYMETET